MKNEGGGNSVSTVLLRGSTESILDDLERAVDDGVNTYKVCSLEPHNFCLKNFVMHCNVREAFLLYFHLLHSFFTSRQCVKTAVLFLVLLLLKLNLQED